MSRPRTDVGVIELKGEKSNLRKAMNRRLADIELTPDERRELVRLNRLIATSYRDCLRGSTIGKAHKSNPAFRIFIALLRAKAAILRGKKLKKSAQSVKQGPSFSEFFALHPDPPGGAA